MSRHIRNTCLFLYITSNTCCHSNPCSFNSSLVSNFYNQEFLNIWFHSSFWNVYKKHVYKRFGSFLQKKKRIDLDPLKYYSICFNNRRELFIERRTGFNERRGEGEQLVVRLGGLHLN